VFGGICAVSKGNRVYRGLTPNEYLNYSISIAKRITEEEITFSLG